MKKTALVIVIMGFSLGLFAQKVIRVGVYDVIYNGTIIDTVLVHDPAVFYGRDTIKIMVKDTIILSGKTEVTSKSTLPLSMKSGFEIGVFGGLAWINNKRLEDDFWKSRSGLSFGIEGSYRRKFGKIFDLGIGLSFSMSQRTIFFDINNESIENIIDKDNDKYTGKFTYNKVNEKNTLFLLGIPITLGFDNISLNRVGFYTALVFRPAIVVSNSFDVSGSYESTGYYPDWDIELRNIAELGFYPDKNIEAQENISKATACLSGKAAIGITIPLSRHEDYDYNRSLLKVGIFAEYGKIFAKQGDIAIEESNYHIGQNNLMTGSSVSMMNFGIELGFLVGMKKQ